MASLLGKSLLLLIVVIFLGTNDASLLSLILGTSSSTSSSSSTRFTDSGPICNKRSTTSPQTGLPNCSLSFDEIPSGRQVPGSTIQPTPLPSWINVTLAQIGQKFSAKNRFSVTLGALTGLLTGLPFPDARDVLAFTRMSDTNSAAIKRYLATATQMYVWIDELFQFDLLAGNGVFHQSIANVRVLHIEAAAKANARPKAIPLNTADQYAGVELDDEMWAAIAKDLEASDLVYRDYNSSYSMYDSSQVYINQFIQGVTLVGFMGYTVIDPESVLLWDVTDEELKGYLHMWAIIGYAVGLQDEYNPCLQPDVASARAYYLEIQNKLAIPAFFKIDRVGKVLIEALLEGVNNYIPGLGIRATMYRLLRDHFKIPVPNMKSILTLSDRIGQAGYDSIFVPLTKVLSSRTYVNQALMAGVNALVAGNFGLAMTDDQKARQAFYPSV